MSNTIHISRGDSRRFKARNGKGENNIFIKVCFNNVANLLMYPSIHINKPVRKELEFNKVDYAGNPDLYKIVDDNVTYIGTVGSFITDISKDIYYVNETVTNKDGVESKLGYFMAIPTLLVIPNIDRLQTREYDLTGTIIGVLTNNSHTQGTVSDLGNDGVTVIMENAVVAAPASIKGVLITLPGADADSLYNTTEVYTHEGQCNGDGFKPSQYLVLGDVSTLFTTVPDYIPITELKDAFYNMYGFSRPQKAKITSGVICIPLNF